MALDRLQNSGLTRALTDLLADFAELIQKELQLAKTEITEKITAGLRASVWMVVAGMLGLMAALFVLEAAVFAIASFGLALYWSCLLVAAALAAAGTAVFYRGRSMAQRDLLPNRTATQITRDIKTAKEQLT
jgi:mannose/fructose/N-acetylgalactosamine-specific phosphotransferase system component IIC